VNGSGGASDSDAPPLAVIPAFAVASGLSSLTLAEKVRPEKPNAAGGSGLEFEAAV